MAFQEEMGRAKVSSPAEARKWGSIFRQRFGPQLSDIADDASRRPDFVTRSQRVRASIGREGDEVQGTNPLIELLKDMRGDIP